MKNVPAEWIGADAMKWNQALNEFRDVKISYLTTKNNKISAVMTCRVRLRLFATWDEMRKVRSVSGKREQMVFFFLYEKGAMAPSHLQIILITERGSLPWETAQWIWLLLQGVLISSSVYKQQSLPAHTHTLNRMHLTDNHIHREIMIPNQLLCKQCLTWYAQELDGLHLRSFLLWKA